MKTVLLYDPLKIFLQRLDDRYTNICQEKDDNSCSHLVKLFDKTSLFFLKGESV